MSQDDTMIRLAALRKNLKEFMNPEILRHLADFLEKTAYGETSLMERYEWFCKNAENGPDCRYAAMAKTFFLRDQADSVAKEINWLYENWSKNYQS
jgi:hypothetical protein